MEELLQKIRAIYTTNEEIIARVEGLAEVLLYEYHYKPKKAVDDIFELEEVCRKVKVQTLIQEFQFKGDLRTNIWDIFNDKPNWACSSWADLKRLNKELHAIVDKFELLDKSNAKTKGELAKYLHNFEVIQTGLGELESKTLSEESRLLELQQQVDEMNILWTALKESGVTVTRNEFEGGSVLNTAQATKLTEWYGNGWKLIYKASQDGWQGTDFHSKCDGKGETITVIKSGNNIFGGHLGASWISGGDYIRCDDASLFTLVNVYGIAPTKFNVSAGRGEHSGTGHPTFGPTFGGGYDLYIASNANTNSDSYSNFPCTYKDTSGMANHIFAGTRNFQVSEIEVYGKM